LKNAPLKKLLPQKYGYCDLFATIKSSGEKGIYKLCGVVSCYNIAFLVSTLRRNVPIDKPGNVPKVVEV
jgi:hypothetical protein